MEEDFEVTKPDTKALGKVRKHTVVETAKGRLYVCKLCNESFDKSYALANHVKSFCPKRAIVKKEPSYPLIEGPARVQEHAVNDESTPVVSDLTAESTKQRPQRTKRQKVSQQEKDTHIPPTPIITYANPLRSTNPANVVHAEEYEKPFLPNYPLDLVFKLKSLKALKIALDASLITPEQFTIKQDAFVHSVSF